MRIAIDGYNLAMPNGTGVATYAVELARALRSLDHNVEGVFGIPVSADPALREATFFNAFKREAESGRRLNRYQRSWSWLRSFRRPVPRNVPLSSQVETLAFDGDMPHFDRLVSAGDLFANAFTFFGATGRFATIRLPDPPAIMHWTYPVPVRIADTKNIYTLHDLVPLKLPYTTLDDKTLYGGIVAECVRTAAHICTVSASSRNDILERFTIDPSRITNTYQAASTRSEALAADPAADARSIEGVFGLKYRGYFLYFGAIEPKKNVGRLIEAYLSLQTSTPLVLVGARAWQSERELRLMPSGGASGAAGTYQGFRGQTIMRMDYLPRALLAKLVRNAKGVVFPSLYEGFGLPVLEAMQLGTPVITSNTSSLPEVAGDAGLLVNPYDVNALIEAMRRLDEDQTLGGTMAARGLEQAKLFSRERYQERLTELYNAAMASP